MLNLPRKVRGKRMPEVTKNKLETNQKSMTTSKSTAPTDHKKLIAWIDEMAKLCQPDRVVWCDGSEAEKERLEKQSVSSGELIELNPKKLPGCFLHRTAHNDVARTENLTFICTLKKEDAGPNNNWMSPNEAYAKASGIFRGYPWIYRLFASVFWLGVNGGTGRLLPCGPF